MFIDGEFVASLSNETFTVENPATEETIGEVPRARSDDVDRAVVAALKAQDDWRFVGGQFTRFYKGPEIILARAPKPERKETGGDR